MSNSPAQLTTAEALCSAFYRMPFSEFLGEKDMPYAEGEPPCRHAWFHLGEKPKDMRVTIIQPPADDDVVVVIAEWRNYYADGRNPLKGSQMFRISTYQQSQAALMGPVEHVVTTILELYKDVLQETGVAGNLADLMAETEETDDEEDPAYPLNSGTPHTEDI